MSGLAVGSWRQLLVRAVSRVFFRHLHLDEDVLGINAIPHVVHIVITDQGVQIRR